MYPSIQTKRQTVNFAIHPNSIAEKFSLNRVFKMRITNSNFMKQSFSFNMSHIGRNNKGIIQWEEIDVTTDKGKLLMKEIDEIFKIG
jgi:hypothetical protein